MSRKQVALFGLSANPPHAGHAAILHWLCTGPLDFDNIWVMPTVHHAFDKPLAPYEDRAAMVEAMVSEVRSAAFPRGTVARRISGYGLHGPENGIKVVRREEQYTVETVEALIAENPDTEFTVVLGADIIHEVSKWHRWSDLQRLAKVVFVTRKGVEVPLNIDYPIYTIDAPDVSSTDIRHRIASGDLTYLVGTGADVPASVFKLIEAKRLYGHIPPKFSQKVWVYEAPVPVEALEQLGPGTSFQLRGNIRQVLSVRPDPHQPPDGKGGGLVSFQVLKDTSMERELHNDTRRWLERQTEARSKGVAFEEPKPFSASHPLQFLKIGDEEREVRIKGRFLGQAGEYMFWVDDEKGGGLFGGMLGLF